MTKMKEGNNKEKIYSEYCHVCTNHNIILTSLIQYVGSVKILFFLQLKKK